jgi:hypothetical protein
MFSKLNRQVIYQEINRKVLVWVNSICTDFIAFDQFIILL